MKNKTDDVESQCARDFAHQNSYTIHSRIRILQCELEEADKSIVAMTGALENLKARRLRVRSMIRGMSSVIEKR